MKSAIVFVVLLLVNSWSLALGYTVEITEREIQDKVSASQPLQHQRLGTTFILDSIKIDLVESTDKIAIKTDIEIKSLGELKLFGGVKLRGGLRYQRETGEFFIKDSEIIDIEFRGVSDGSKERLKKAAQIAAKLAFDKTPVYKLNDTTKQRLAKALIESVEIKDEKVLVKLSL